jgi:hypothetical protein
MPTAGAAACALDAGDGVICGSYPVGGGWAQTRRSSGLAVQGRNRSSAFPVSGFLPLRPMGAENLRDQAIFVNYTPGAIAPLDPELTQIRDTVGQLPQRRCLLQGAMGPMRVIGAADSTPGSDPAARGGSSNPAFTFCGKG